MAIDGKAVALVTATVATSAAVTYLVTKRIFENKATLVRKAQYAVDQKAVQDETQERRNEGLPTGLKLE